jgi:ribosomal protein S18 acetylase RimI-like enzyme
MIKYSTEKIPSTSQVIEVFRSSGIKRPIDQPARIEQMLKQADLIVTAWDGKTLVGIARSLTDFCYACYLSDLAVRREYQNEGIGKKLVHLTREKTGPQCMLLLLSAPEAIEYYPKIGFEKVGNGYIIKRER